MRLTQGEVEHIVSTFKHCFLETDAIYLFGSRLDDQKRGGDIDLFIETLETDPEKRWERKMNFLVMLKNNIGDQKIDVIIHAVGSNKKSSIVEHAQETGVKLA